LDTLFQDARLKIRPLCYEIRSGSMIEPAEFWNDAVDRDDRIFYVNNDPLIAPAGHPLLCKALNRATCIILNALDQPEIQSTTGPGNLSATLVEHAIASKLAGAECDFLLLRDWERISATVWNLSYRNDARNWRLLRLRPNDGNQAHGS
jgi:hypothetical protein